MAKDDTFRRTCRARGKEQEGRVVAVAAHWLARSGTASRDEIAALLQECVVAEQLRLAVVPHAAVFIVDDAANRWAPRQDLEQLVDLFLVLGEDVGNPGALNRRHQFV